MAPLFSRSEGLLGADRKTDFPSLPAPYSAGLRSPQLDAFPPWRAALPSRRFFSHYVVIPNPVAHRANGGEESAFRRAVAYVAAGRRFSDRARCFLP
jgi:hypothetical protein